MAHADAKALEPHLPLLRQLSGTTAWNASVNIRNRGANILVESSLQGLASTLPADRTTLASFSTWSGVLDCAHILACVNGPRRVKNGCTASPSFSRRLNNSCADVLKLGCKRDKSLESRSTG